MTLRELKAKVVASGLDIVIARKGSYLEARKAAGQLITRAKSASELNNNLNRVEGWRV